jgi:two-component system sensor histidine kinase UhpB
MVHVAAIRDISSRVQTEENLVELNQKLRALSGHLQSVQEQERLAISRDIHDDVGQSLTVLKLDLTWLEQNLAPVENDIAVRMKAMRVTIDQISAIVQRIAANLRPPLLDNQGLSAAIEWHVNEFSRRSGIECFIMLNEDSDSIDEETATTVMRIVQESLTNIVRHAFATEVGISLCQRDGNLILEISDNGCGITREQIDNLNSFGLLGMQERAKLCKGEFKISGTPGCGTILQLTIPRDFFGGKV